MNIREEKKPFYLAYSCDFKIPESENKKIKIKRAANYFAKNLDCYGEEYHYFEDLEKRLKNIYAWNVKDYPDVLDGYAGYAFYRLHILDNEEQCWPLGISPFGWSISLLYLQRLYEYFEEKFGKENLYKMIELKLDQTQILFCDNPVYEGYLINTYELVSEKTALIILENFLNGKHEIDLDPDIYYQEIKRLNLGF